MRCGRVLAIVQARAAVASDVIQLVAALPPLARAVRYGDVRGPPPRRCCRCSTGSIERVLVGLPSACASLDDDAAARDGSTRWPQVDEAVTLLDDPTAIAAWLDAARRPGANATRSAPLVRGFAARLAARQGPPRARRPGAPRGAGAVARGPAQRGRGLAGRAAPRRGAAADARARSVGGARRGGSPRSPPTRFTACCRCCAARSRRSAAPNAARWARSSVRFRAARARRRPPRATPSSTRRAPRWCCRSSRQVLGVPHE